MNIPTTPISRTGAAGDVARRLATFVGPGLAAPDDSTTAAVYLALGATIATTRAYTSRSLVECFPHLAVDSLAAWERSLGMLSGEGDAVAARQRAITARWRAAHAGPSIAEVTTTARSYDATATLREIAMVDVIDVDPHATERVVVLLDAVVEADARTRAALGVSLGVELPAHVTWSLARGAGPDLDPFLCDDAESLCDRDVLNV